MRSGRQAGASRRGTHLLVLFAVVVLAVGVIWWLDRGPAEDFGAGVARQLATTAAPPAVTASDQPVPSVPVQAAALPVAGSVLRPVALAIPSIGVTARVEPTGVDDRGEFVVPPSIDTIGWYRFGPGLEAAAGSVVIAGHVDSATDGNGAFHRLGDVRPGDEVAVTGEDGGVRRYRVVAREQLPKKTLDLAPYFATTGAPRLTLFTCGGEFDSAARSYVDNIVVTAVPE